MKKSHKLFVSVTSTALLLGSMLIGDVAFAQSSGQAPAQSGEARGWGARGMMGERPGVFGKVTAINGSTLTVDSTRGRNSGTVTTYSVNASNATVTKDGASSALSSVAVGDMIMAEGTVQGTTVTATTIRDGMMGRGMGRRPVVFGSVASVSGSSLTVTSNDRHDGSAAKTFTIDASAAKVNKDGVASSLANVVVGDMVAVDGTVQGTNVAATTINDGMPGGRGPGRGQGPMQTSIIQGNGQPVVGGNVTAVSGMTLTVTNKSGVTYSVDATNAKIAKNNATSSVSEIAVGDAVMVQGTVNGSNITASSVMDAGQPQAAPQAAPQSGFAADETQVHPSGPGFMGMIGGFFHKLFGFF